MCLTTKAIEIDFFLLVTSVGKEESSLMPSNSELSLSTTEKKRLFMYLEHGNCEIGNFRVFPLSRASDKTKKNLFSYFFTELKIYHLIFLILFTNKDNLLILRRHY